ncbi:hypothetical protein PG985_015563 [Apiospora marii]|uniref:uncharacterized protein n=1 Tax=Apiospora marii TaxID=335849 RepID=UPI00312F815D
MSFRMGIEAETAGPGPAGDEGSFWGLCLSEPVYNAEWVDASVVEFLQCVNAMPPNERLQRVQDFLEEGIIKLRDSVRFSCDIYQGFPTQGESALSNIGLVSEAIRRVSAWEQELQQRVYAQEMQMEGLLRRGIDNEQALNTSSQDPDPQPMRSPSVSSDDSIQPMDISSGSSDDEGDPHPAG